MGRRSGREEKANVLILGAGGREHAIGRKLRQSDKVGELLFASGNAGTARLGTNIPLNDFSFEDGSWRDLIRERQIGLVIIGSERLLGKGLVDQFLQLHVPVFGPTKDVAQIETSKAFAKNLMQSLGVPTPQFIVCRNFADIKEALPQFQPPYVLKRNGLAQGKGVHIFSEIEEATDWATTRFRAFDEPLLVEEHVEGPEASMLALCDGTTYTLLPSVMDYKRAFNGDRGGMTGSMGSVAPCPEMPQGMWEQIGRRVIKPVLQHFKQDERGFRGCLFVGLKLTTKGPMVLEYNARLGDSETQTLFSLLWDNDLVDTLFACALGSLELHLRSMGRYAEQSMKIMGHAVTVTVSDADYPKDSRSSISIPASALANLPQDIHVFHGNTSLAPDGSIASSGGRILSITAIDHGMKSAHDKAYAFLDGRLKPVPNIRWRTDIGADVPSFNRLHL